MSSSIAMNRRISRDGGNNVNNSFDNYQKQPEMRQSLQGTPIQQHYQILNFHESRLNAVFKQVQVLTTKLEKLEPETNLRLHRLEQENAALRRHINDLQKTDTTQVKVNIEDN